MSRVGLDLDGVFYPFDHQFRQCLIVCEGMDEEQLTPFPSATWEFFHAWGLTLQDFLDYSAKHVDAGHIYRLGAPVEENTKETLQTLRDAGHSLHIVTARFLGSPGPREAATAEWLQTHFPKFDSLTFTNNKDDVRLDYMIEDNVDNYDKLIAAGVDAWLIDRPWNVHATHARRVYSVKEFVDRIITIEAAKVPHLV